MAEDKEEKLNRIFETAFKYVGTALISILAGSLLERGFVSINARDFSKKAGDPRMVIQFGNDYFTKKQRVKIVAEIAGDPAKIKALEDSTRFLQELTREAKQSIIDKYSGTLGEQGKQSISR